MLSCGVSQGLPGFSTPDDKGNWTGIDVDILPARLPRRSSTMRARSNFVPAVGQGTVSRRLQVPAKSTYCRAIQPGRYPRDNLARRQL